jgi:monovalent cation/proton antiporter MnhG/PhaG subunit
MSAQLVDIMSVAGKLVGVAFLLVAAIGVMRFQDPFMRMHAATKAGTLGAGLVVIFTALYMGEPGAKLTALAIIVFLLATLPVAAHLLGRAAYVSGAPFEVADQRNALEGILVRQRLPLEQRLRKGDGGQALTPFWAFSSDTRDRPAGFSPGTEPEGFAELPPITQLSDVTVPVIETLPATAYRRIAALAMDAGVPATALATLDRRLVDDADRETAAQVLAEMRDALDRLIEGRLTDRRYTIQYDETDPVNLAHTQLSAAGLLVLPQHGWFNHGVELPVTCFQRSSDKLLAFAVAAPPRKLFLPERPVVVKRVLVIDDGSTVAAAQLRWVIAHRIWPDADILVAAENGRELSPRRRAYLMTAAEAAGGQVAFPDSGGIEKHVYRCGAICLPGLRPPLRTDWYGQFWLDRIATSWRGEVLVP